MVYTQNTAPASYVKRFCEGLAPGDTEPVQLIDCQTNCYFWVYT